VEIGRIGDLAIVGEGKQIWVRYEKEWKVADVTSAENKTGLPNQSHPKFKGDRRLNIKKLTWDSKTAYCKKKRPIEGMEENPKIKVSRLGEHPVHFGG